MLEWPQVRRCGWVTSLLGVALACGSGTIENDAPGSGATAGSGGSALSGAGGQAGSAAGQGGSPATGGSAGSGGGKGGGGAGTAGATGGAGDTGGAAGANGGVGGMGGAFAGGAGTGGSAGASGDQGTGGVSATGGTGGMAGGTGGSSGKGGAGGSSGKGGASGAGTGGGAGTGAAGMPGSCSAWPTANGSQSVPSTIAVSGTYDGMMKRFSGSGELDGGGQDEGQDPLFRVANGGTLKNVILGNPAADGVHCDGACTLENVWWEDVGEDAATFRGSSSAQTMTVRCGGAKQATDKVFQHNGAGTLTIQSFQADGFGKLYRSCGNCSTQYARHVILEDVTARSGSALVGINTNYGDSADFARITIDGNFTICERYTGNDSGDEPVRTGTGADSQYCRYEESDITRR
jgi:pectate lyase